MSFMHRLVSGVGLATLALSLGACFGLGKRNDAEDAKAASASRRLASPAEPQSSLARASGQGTQLRLLHLFPGSAASLPDKDFAFEGAEGLNRAFGQQARPSEALAQMALRSKVAALCKDGLSAASVRLFKLEAGSSLLDGETAPSDPAVAAALAAARNAWLHPYKADDVEVRELIGIYGQVSGLAGADGGDAGGKRAVCMAALLAPQFWMGTAEIDDAAKRVSVELFRRIPPMQEMQDFLDRKFTMDQYFDRLLADNAAKEGFRKTTRQWHEEWLGFREFIDPALLDADRRSSSIDQLSPGASDMAASTFGPDSRVTSAAPQTIAPSRQAGLNAAACVNTTAQSFDPDTKMVAWEHYNFDVPGYNFAGGYFRSGATMVDSGAGAGLVSVDDAAAALAGIGLMPAADSATRRAMLRDLCADRGANGAAPASPFTDQAGASWRRCDGALALSAASADRVRDTFVTLINDARAWDGYSKQTTLTTWPMSVWCGTHPDKPGCMAYYQSVSRYYRDTYINDMHATARRIKRYAGGAIGVNTLVTKLDAMLAAVPSGSSLGNVVANAPRVTEFVTLSGEAVTGAAQALTDLRNEIAAGGWVIQVNLSDMKVPNPAGKVDLGGGTLEQRYNYNGGTFDRIVGSLGVDGRNRYLPIVDVARSPAGWAQQHRRVRRLGGVTGQWQDGYSTVKLWYTGGTVAVCNNADRLWASCFYRPRAVTVPGAAMSSFRPDQARLWNAFYSWLSDSAMHPQVASGFYCGLPSSNDLAQIGADPNAAYAPLKISTSQLNDVASNIDLQLLGAPVAPNSALGVESAAFKDIYKQLREEPYKLIDKLVLGKQDYRKLLTDEQTTGNRCLKFFYDTQGFYLPRHDDAAGAACAPGGADAPFGPGPAIPSGHLLSSGGGIQGEDATLVRQKMWLKVHNTTTPAQIPPRVHSGIITMPAFIAPLGTGGALKARGVSSRYFSRVLCDQPNFYDPLKDKEKADQKDALHRSFVSNRKHLAQDCYQCHRNLDPLASAMSWTFQGLLGKNMAGDTVNKDGGEGGPQDFIGELDVPSVKGILMPGLRHAAGPESDGAFMGKPVHGIRELGVAIAESDKFAACVTQTMFGYLFGRTVQFADVGYFNEMTATFKDPAKANYRYVDLLKAMIKSDYYLRKN